MTNLKMQTPNKINENVERIATLFPNCVTESISEDGKPAKVVDFDLLRQELSGFAVEGQEERYQFTWADKKKSILLANSPISKTLRPCREESVNFDTTKNLYIEGDNLEVLKLLQETYMGKVKMIYIDPPYNTGNDFVYEDDFAISAEEYFERSGSSDDEGNRLFQNNDSNGRFHTDWLNMIYPRLKLARDLLTDEGVIFISIDDNEVHNLHKVCDEVFGARNFIGLMTIQSNPRGSQSSKYLSNVHEYIIMYTKSESELKLKGVAKAEGSELEYNETDSTGRKYRLLGLRQRGGAWRKEQRQLLHYPIYINSQNGKVSLTKTDEHTVIVIPARPTGELGRWTWSKEKLQKCCSQVVGKKINRSGQEDVWDIFRKDYIDNDDGTEKTAKIKTIWIEKEINYQNAKNELKELFGNSDFFDYPKPTYIVKKLAEMLYHDEEDFIILDFFSGSATTAHAVMQSNAKDNGDRRFIMVQLPEETPEGSEARKAGYNNICKIGKERIRRAGRKIADENRLTAPNLDIGFRVLKVDSGNMKPVFYNPEASSQNLLSNTEGNIKDDRTPEDLLFQVMLDMGVDLASPITVEQIGDKKVFVVGDNNLICCFDKDVNKEAVTEIAKRKPLYAVFRDNGFERDDVMISIDQIFETYSPATERRVL
jgi:adenine-specific DNA-methyltransferase